MKKAKLQLEDGHSFEGELIGVDGETVGEVCFNTGMTGYQEILTDPSYHRQIVTMTAPHIGNYGINNNDQESSKIQVAGFIIKEETAFPSNWRSTDSIGNFLMKNNIIGIKNVDTRAIVSHIRDNGAMNGIISSLDYDRDSLNSKIQGHPSMDGLDLAKEVSCSKKYLHNTNKKIKFNVAVIDFGIKKNILRILSDIGCRLSVFPADVTKEEIIDEGPDGIFLSNGPGDPSVVTYAIDTIKSLLGYVPMFGICLGHQIFGLALGGQTYKLKFGHRGLNHPCGLSNRVEITSQNHGFAIDAKSIPNNVAEITHYNLNDKTVAGLKVINKPIFSVQYHPEAGPGPHDSDYLFNNFVSLMLERC